MSNFNRPTLDKIEKIGSLRNSSNPQIFIQKFLIFRNWGQEELIQEKLHSLFQVLVTLFQSDIDIYIKYADELNYMNELDNIWRESSISQLLTQPDDPHVEEEFKNKFQLLIHDFFCNPKTPCSLAERYIAFELWCKRKDIEAFTKMLKHKAKLALSNRNNQERFEKLHALNEQLKLFFEDDNEIYRDGLRHSIDLDGN